MKQYFLSGLIILITMCLSCSKSHQNSGDDGGIDTFLEDTYTREDTYTEEDTTTEQDIQQDVEQNCETQDVGENLEILCDSCFEGCYLTPYSWNGERCVYNYFCCGCTGEDCDNMFATLDSCEAAYQQCEIHNLQPLYPSAKLKWDVSEGFTGWGNVLMMDGNGVVRFWNNVAPWDIDWNSTNYDKSVNLGVEAANEIFTKLSSIDCSSIPHEVQGGGECYPSFYLNLCETCNPIDFGYYTAESLLPEFESIYVFFEERLCSEIEYLELPGYFCDYGVQPEPNWILNLTGLDSYSEPVAIAENNGNINISGEVNGNIWMVKMDENGSLLQQKYYELNGNILEIKSMKKTDDGGVILTGFSNNGDDFNCCNTFLVKFNSLDEIEWQKITTNGTTFSTSIIMTNEGNFIFIGYLGIADNLLIIKFNREGEIIWQKVYEGGLAIAPVALTETSNGDIAILANVFEDDGGYNNILVLKINSSGELLWNKIIQLTGYEHGTSITATSNGDIWVNGDVSTDEGSNDLDKNLLIIKLSSSGDVVLQKIIVGIDINEDYVEMYDSIFRTSDNGVVVLGNSGNTSDINYIHLLKFSQNGDVVWQHSLGETFSYYGISANESSDDGLLLLGTRQFYINDIESYFSTVVAKLNRYGETNYDCSIINDTSFVMHDINSSIIDPDTHMEDISITFEVLNFVSYELSLSTNFSCP